WYALGPDGGVVLPLPQSIQSDGLAWGLAWSLSSQAQSTSLSVSRQSRNDFMTVCTKYVCDLLLQKVCTDCPGNFSWGLFVDPKVVELWKLLCFRSREDHCKPLHGPLCLCGAVFPAIHEQDTCGY